MNRRRLPAWLASLALLIHLLSMPLSGLLPAETKRLLGWSGHCPLMQAQVQQSHALHESAVHGENDSGTHGAHGMPPCLCCAGSVGLAALPGASALLPLQPVGHPIHVAESRDHWPSPRQQWPALNPRASPLA